MKDIKTVIYQNNQVAIYVDNERYFNSYNSQIAHIKNGIVILTNHYNYSRTTSKYLYMFLRDNGINVNNKKEMLQYIEDNNIQIIEKY